jgi:FeS assembly SUF system protein
MMNPEESLQISERIIQVLKTIFDPEIPVNIYDLGLIYEVHVDDDGTAHIQMTLTAPNCPEAENIPVEVHDKVNLVTGVTDTVVELVFDPPWDQTMMSENALLELGFL